MDTKDLKGLMEAYSEVYAPEQLEEMEVKLKTPEERAKYIEDAKKREERKKQPSIFDYARKRKEEGRPLKINLSRAVAAQNKKEAEKRAALKKEELDIFDVVLEFLQVEGFAETLEEAEWLMANVIDGEAIGIILGVELEEGEGSYGQTPKASAAYTALHTGKGKSKTKSLALKHAVRSAADRYNSDKPYTHRSKMTQSDRDYHRGQSENRGKDREGIDFDEFDTGASGPGGMPKGKKLERQRKRGVSAEAYDYVNEAQAARENPEKYEREQAKKSAPVRGERTPMPPRGDKRREDFEKWYRANVR